MSRCEHALTLAHFSEADAYFSLLESESMVGDGLPPTPNSEYALHNHPASTFEFISMPAQAAYFILSSFNRRYVAFTSYLFIPSQSCYHCRCFCLCVTSPDIKVELKLSISGTVLSYEDTMLRLSQ